MRLIWQLLAWPLGLMMWAWTRLVLLTSRLDVADANPAEEPCIYVLWHRHLPVLEAWLGRRGAVMMMSRSPHMAPIARWSRLLGMGIVHGTSGQDGRGALERLGTELDHGRSVVLAVDGPAGPAFTARRGCVDLALQTGRAIVALGYQVRRGGTLPGRWDRSLMPVPFDRISLARAPAIQVSETDDPLARLSEVTAALDALDPAAERLRGGKRSGSRRKPGGG